MNVRFVCFLAFCGSLFAQSSQPSLTIYNQNFAVVRQEMPLDLKAGENQVNINDITMHLSPTPSFCATPVANMLCRCWNRIIAPIRSRSFPCFRCMKAARLISSYPIAQR